MSISSRQHQHRVGTRSALHSPRHCAAPPSHLSELGVDVIATRLRTLGHPTRLRLMRALDGRHATAEQLAAHLDEPLGAVRAHLGVLYRGGVVCRVDDGGPPTYALADWPSLWLVERLAHRLRAQAIEDAPPACDDAEEASSC
jgi:DNA-binding transcriptional ArsR family regulator